MSDYSQTRSFNLGIAEDTSIEAAMIYDDLVYAQKVFGKGYFFRSDEQMLKRFPIMSKSTVRRNVAKLVDAGLISTKVKKVNGKPVLNYQIEHSLLFNLTKTKEIVKMNNSLLETKEQLQSPDSDSSFGENSNSATASRDTARRQYLQTIIEIVNPKEKATDERLRLLNGRLKDYTMDEIIQSANAFSKSEWHRENKQMSIDNLLAPSKFGRWYAQRTTESAAPEVKMSQKEYEEKIANEVIPEAPGWDGADAVK